MGDSVEMPKFKNEYLQLINNIAAFVVNTVLIRSQCPLAQLSALLTLGGVIIRQGEPRSDTRHQATEGLHIDHFAVAVVERWRELCLHVLLQLTLGHILQYGLCHLPSLLTPILAVGLQRLLHFLGLNRCQRHQCYQYKKYFLHKNLF